MLDLKELGDRILESAKENLARDGSLMPILLTQYMDPNKKNTIFGLAFNGTEEKRKTYAALNLLFAMDPPDAIVMVNDTWLKAVDIKTDPDGPARMGRHGVEAEPDRKEAIIVIVSPRDGEDTLLTQPYHRDGEKIVWEEQKTPEYTSFQNRLLPPNWKRSNKTKAS